VASGLSIANNLLANQVQLNLNNNQSQLQKTVNQLSSGLRINSAADDPSGLAIAESLQTQVNGFDQGSSNVQNAINAAQVADGALATTTDILQRISTLAVEASNDITSTADKTNLQAEVSQLLQEVNTISQNTSFNGQALLDGSHAGFQPETNASVSITANAALASAGTAPAVQGVNTGLLVAAAVAANANFNTTDATVSGLEDNLLGVAGAPPGPAAGIQGLNGPVFVIPKLAESFNIGNTGDGTIELQVINTGVSIAVQEAFFSSAGTANLVSVATQLFGANQTTTLFDNVAITTGNFSTADVGATSFIKISQNVAASSNPNAPAFNFQSGASEGDTIQLGIQATNTQTLRISNINLLLSSSAAPSLGAEDAIGQVNNALNTLLTQRAQLGAIIVRLQGDQDNDNTAAVNLQASESNIRDLDVAQATTEFTKLQVLAQVGTSVLSQANANAQSVLGLFR
jgi:flagellin